MPDSDSVIRLRAGRACAGVAPHIGGSLAHRRTVIDLWSSGGPFWARGFYAVAFPAVASAVKRMYKTTDVEGVARAKQRFGTAFDELDPVLLEQPYLGGDAPNRADITLAALLAPVCRVPEHRVKWPPMPPRSSRLRSEPPRPTDLESRIADVP